MHNTKTIVSVGLKDKVTFDQLPEQIQSYYIGPSSGSESLWLTETRAVLQFLPPPPYVPWVDYWAKTTSGNWGLVRCEKGAKTDAAPDATPEHLAPLGRKDELPEQIREHYRLNIPKRRVWKVLLNQQQAHVRFAPRPDEEGLTGRGRTTEKSRAVIRCAARGRWFPPRDPRDGLP